LSSVLTLGDMNPKKSKFAAQTFDPFSFSALANHNTYVLLTACIGANKTAFGRGPIPQALADLIGTIGELFRAEAWHGLLRNSETRAIIKAARFSNASTPGSRLYCWVLGPAVALGRLLVILRANALHALSGLHAHLRNIPQGLLAFHVANRGRLLHALACHFSIIECCPLVVSRGPFKSSSNPLGTWSAKRQGLNIVPVPPNSMSASCWD
jgi:hypothetical protein